MAGERIVLHFGLVLKGRDHGYAHARLLSFRINLSGQPLIRNRHFWYNL